MKDFYSNYLAMYLLADDEQRDESKKHWIRCHKENIKSNRDDMICFSAKILALQAIADDTLKNKAIV